MYTMLLDVIIYSIFHTPYLPTIVIINYLAINIQQKIRATFSERTE